MAAKINDILSANGLPNVSEIVKKIAENDDGGRVIVGVTVQRNFSINYGKNTIVFHLGTSAESYFHDSIGIPFDPNTLKFKKPFPFKIV